MAGVSAGMRKNLMRVEDADDQSAQAEETAEIN